tara:strand:+ start:190 stop:609 length:420 start_codon:yes stop_codon:yes gene_type:complete
MSKIIYEKSDGTVVVIHPVDSSLSISDIASKTVPDGTSYEVVSDTKIPSDRTFRDAWVKGSGVVTEDVTKAKVIAHKIRREKRELEFEPYDSIISLNIPGQDSDAAETARASIRTKYATMQTNINNASDIAGIKTALGG